MTSKSGIKLGSITFTMLASLLVGCNNADMQEWNWDWFGANKKDARPTTRADATPRTGDAQVATADTNNPRGATPDDSKASSVQGDVNAYVQSMPPREEDDYAQNDLMSKIRRQEDPNRPERIRQAAARARGQESDWESGDVPAMADADSPTGYPTGPIAQDDERGAVRTATASDADSYPDLKAAEDSAVPPPTAGRTAATAEPLVAAPLEPVTEPETKDAHFDDATTSADTNTRADHKPVSVAVDPADNEPVIDDEADSSINLIDNESGAAPSRISANAPARIDESDDMDSADDNGAGAPVVSNITVASGNPMEKMPVEGSLSNNHESTNAMKAAPIVEPPVDTFKKMMEELESDVAKDPNDLDAQLRLRMAYLLNDQDDKAIAEIPGTDEEVQAIITAQMKAFLAARTDFAKDPATWANRQLGPVEDLSRLVRAKADLRIPRIILCKDIQGYDLFEAIDPPEFTAGRKNKCYVYVEIENFSSEQTGSGKRRTLLSIRYSLLNETGKELWHHSEQNVEDISNRQRRDFFVTFGVAVPRTLTPGEYTLKVEVEDVLAGKINGKTTSFKIVP